MKHRHLHQTCREGNYQHFDVFGCDYSTIVMLGQAKYMREGVWPSLGFTSTVSLCRKLAGGGEVAPGGEEGPHTLVVCRADSGRGRRCLSGELASADAPLSLHVGIRIQSVISATAAQRSSTDCTPSICSCHCSVLHLILLVCLCKAKYALVSFVQNINNVKVNAPLLKFSCYM